MELAGTWRLTSFVVPNAEEETHPLGPDAVGLLIFTEDGWFSAQIMQPNRPQFATNNWTRGTDEEVRAAFVGYVAYFGTYAVDRVDAVIQLEPIGTLYPNWLGQTQTRFASMDGNALHLTTPPMATPRGTVTARLSWEKIS
jgi:hypothetical protein